MIFLMIMFKYTLEIEKKKNYFITEACKSSMLRMTGYLRYISFSFFSNNVGFSRYLFLNKLKSKEVNLFF